jgi:hypothetical protein
MEYFFDTVLVLPKTTFCRERESAGGKHLHTVLRLMASIRLVLAIIATVIGLLLMAPLLVLALPFWIVSILTRGVSRLIEPRFLTRDQLIEFDGIFGWKPRPNLNTHHLMVDLFQLATDPDGWRGRATLQESEIVVIGDSFAAGYGVSERHFFANLHPRLKIKPIGIGGYCMVQELLWKRHLTSQLRGKLVVWFIYHGNDLYDNLSPDLRGYRKPFLRQQGRNGDWEIVSSHLSPAQWSIVTQTRLKGWHHLPKLAELCSDTFLAERAYSACEYLLSAGQQVCSATDADLVIMTIPDPCQLTPEGQRGLKACGGDSRSFDPYLPDKQIEAACRRLGIAFLAGRTFLDASCYKTNDCHWNEKGHRKVSEMLTRFYNEQKYQVTARQVEEANV